MAETKSEKGCICPSCPSYKDCSELFFCLKEKSKCIKQEKGCLCPSCPVQMKNKFTKAYYCTRGSAKQQK